MYGESRPGFKIRPVDAGTKPSVGASGSSEKFSKFLNIATGAIYNAAGVQNPEDVSEVTSKVLSLVNSVRAEYLRVREVDQQRKNDIRAMQARPLPLAATTSTVASKTQTTPIQISPACEDFPRSLSNGLNKFHSPTTSATTSATSTSTLAANAIASAIASSLAPSTSTSTPAPAPAPVPASLPPIYLPMKPEEVANMTQEQAQALLGNLLSTLHKQQKK